MAPVLAELKIVDMWRAADLPGENQTASPLPAIITPLIAERLAGLDPGAARPRAGIKGLAADRTTGNGPGAAARHVEGRGTSPASSGARWSASRGSPGFDAGAARNHAGIEGLAADRTTGNGPGAAAQPCRA
jgi:hypothetical protein